MDKKYINLKQWIYCVSFRPIGSNLQLKVYKQPIGRGRRGIDLKHIQLIKIRFDGGDVTAGDVIYNIDDVGVDNIDIDACIQLWNEEYDLIKSRHDNIVKLINKI
jgi:fructose-1,6-bisphosphatase